MKTLCARCAALAGYYVILPEHEVGCRHCGSRPSFACSQWPRSDLGQGLMATVVVSVVFWIGWIAKGWFTV